MSPFYIGSFRVWQDSPAYGHIIAPTYRWHAVEVKNGRETGVAFEAFLYENLEDMIEDALAA